MTLSAIRPTALAGVAFCRGQPRLGNQIEHLLGRIKRDMDA